MFGELKTGSLTEPISGRSWDSGTVALEVEKRVARYASMGLRPGDRVFILFGNRLEFFPELLAILPVVEGGSVGGFGDAERLGGDGQACSVHQRHHVGDEAAFAPANELAGCVGELDLAGG